MKAVVLQTQGHEAAILVNDGTVRIAHGKYNVGDIIDYKSVVRRNFLQWAAAAAAMVVLVGIGGGLWIDRNYVTYAEVSLDAKPSIVFRLNKRDRVLGVSAANDDALSTVEQLQDIRFSPLSEAVEKTMTLLVDEGYLNADTDDYVLVNVSADDDTRQARLTAEVESAMATTMEHNPTMEYQIDHSDRKTAKEAAAKGMSVGRYSAWQREDDQTDPADYAEKPVRELMGSDPKDADHSHGEDADRRGNAAQRGDAAPSSDHPQEEGPSSDRKEQPNEAQRPESGSIPGAEQKPESNGSPGIGEKTESGSSPSTEGKPESGGSPGADEKPESSGSPGTEEKTESSGSPGAGEKAESDDSPGADEKPESSDTGQKMNTDSAPSTGDSNPQPDEKRQSEHEPAQQAPSQSDKSPGQSSSGQSKSEPSKGTEQKTSPKESKGDGHQAPPNGGKQDHR